MSKETSRQSNIELLRILAVIGVIILHLNSGAYGGGFYNADRFTACQFVMVLFEVIAISSVDIFVLITGYFMTGKKRSDISKPLRLILNLFVIALIVYIIQLIVSGGKPPSNHLINYIAPDYWFLFVYFGLVIFSPFINKLWDSLSSQNKRKLMLLLFLLLSVIPEIMDLFMLAGVTVISLSGDQSGYTLVNFIFMYLIGCFIKELENNKDAAKQKAAKILHVSASKLKKQIFPVMFVIDTLFLLAAVYIEAWLRGSQPVSTVLFNYNNPLVVLQAVFAFLTFRYVKIPDNKAVNFIAKGVFFVYILHLRFISLFKVPKIYIDDPLMLASFMISMALLIFVLCIICYIAYDFTIGKLIDLIFSKLNKHRYIEVE